MSHSREVYGFDNADKVSFRQEFQTCMYPRYECEQPIENDHVNHLTGCYVSTLRHLDPDSISNIDENGLILCKEHRVDLDNQERYHIEDIMTRSDQEMPYAVEIELVVF